ncbi:MAG: hypothetical protein WDN69_07730 [Aliidongia sp.]
MTSTGQHIEVPRHAFPDWLVALSLVANVGAAGWLGRRRSGVVKPIAAGAENEQRPVRQLRRRLRSSSARARSPIGHDRSRAMVWTDRRPHDLDGTARLHDHDGCRRRLGHGRLRLPAGRGRHHRLDHPVRLPDRRRGDAAPLDRRGRGSAPSRCFTATHMASK